ncbi:glycosyltransferase family 2 protein [Enterococcus sp. LJL99]
MEHISIIVSYTNTYQLLENFLTHLNKIVSTYNYEVIMIQDGAVSSFVNQLISNFEKNNNNIKHIETEKNHLGYSKVNNIAAKCASGDYLLFINTDVFPVLTSIDILLKQLKDSPEKGIAQGLLIYPQTNKIQSAGHVFGSFFNNHALNGTDLDNDLLKENNIRQGLTSAFYMIRKTDFFALNGFDEYFYNAWDGLDLSLRVTYELNKQCIVVPNAKAFHTQGGSRETIFRNTSYQDGYFWYKWKDILMLDFHKLILQQLNPIELSTNYTVINCSSYPHNSWKPLLSNLNCKDPIIDIERYSKKEKIVLEEKIPLQILEGIAPIIFLADHYLDIKNNANIFAIFDLRFSIIADLHGNIYRLPNSKIE